jgi:hypothetical protein
MAPVTLRIFECSSGYDSAGRLVVIGIWLKDEYEMLVRLADVVRVNALAVPLRVSASYRVLRHEQRLLLSYLLDVPHRPLSLRMGDFRASAGHIRRFVSESLGLGMLTAAVQDVYGWSSGRRNLDNFDVLPTRLAHYKSPGVRPDLLFSFDNDGALWRLAGEARGRSTSRPKGPHPTAVQKRRLNEILGWSARHRHHPVVMTWAYTGSSQVKVDLFVLRGEGTTPPHDTEPGTTVPLNIAEDLPVDAIANRAQQNAAVAMDHLYRTAPRFEQARGPWNHQMRGNWVTADLLGQSTTHLLLGILDRAPEQDLVASIRSRTQDRLDRPGQDAIEVDLLGRILVAIARDRVQPPSWLEVANQFE